jgi:hypothetical protein
MNDERQKALEKVKEDTEREEKIRQEEEKEEEKERWMDEWDRRQQLREGAERDVEKGLPVPLFMPPQNLLPRTEIKQPPGLGHPSSSRMDTNRHLSVGCGRLDGRYEGGQHPDRSSTWSARAASGQYTCNDGDDRYSPYPARPSERRASASVFGARAYPTNAPSGGEWSTTEHVLEDYLPGCHQACNGPEPPSQVHVRRATQQELQCESGDRRGFEEVDLYDAVAHRIRQGDR